MEKFFADELTKEDEKKDLKKTAKETKSEIESKESEADQAADISEMEVDNATSYVEKDISKDANSEVTFEDKEKTADEVVIEEDKDTCDKESSSGEKKDGIKETEVEKSNTSDETTKSDEKIISVESAVKEESPSEVKMETDVKEEKEEVCVKATGEDSESKVVKEESSSAADPVDEKCLPDPKVEENSAAESKIEELDDKPKEEVDDKTVVHDVDSKPKLEEKLSEEMTRKDLIAQETLCEKEVITILMDHETKPKTPPENIDESDEIKIEEISNKPEPPKKENALLSLQQMDEAMAKLGAANIDSLATSEPTVAQLLAQSAANPIKWPKERAIQNRVEHIMYAVEKNRWPVDKYFLSNESESRDSFAPPQQQHQQLQQHQHLQQQQIHENDRQQRAVEAEVERAHIQALLHPNLHHTLGLSKTGLSASSLRSFLESEGREKLSASDTNALRQLQALQGSLDLTIRPVNNNPMGEAPPPRRGPGRPRLDDPLRATEKRLAEQLQHLQPQEKKRRKLDEIVMGLSSKSKSPEQITTLPKDTNPLSMLRGSSVSLLSSRDKNILTNSISSPRLSTCISISQNLENKKHDFKNDDRLTPTKSSGDGNNSRLVKQSDLPPGINLPPGIELYRPNESKVDKWLEQHQGMLGESTPSKETSSASSSSSANKRRRLEDWSSQLTGEEHVPLIHSKTGQKVRALLFKHISLLRLVTMY